MYKASMPTYPVTYALYQSESDVVLYFHDQGGQDIEIVSTFRGNLTDDDMCRCLLTRGDARKVWKQAIQDGAERTA